MLMLYVTELPGETVCGFSLATDIAMTGPADTVIGIARTLAIIKKAARAALLFKFLFCIGFPLRRKAGYSLLKVVEFAFYGRREK
jgi:hypothetical protein